MEILAGIIFLLFMILVDWRLNKIVKELQKLNQTADRLIVQVPVAKQLPGL